MEAPTSVIARMSWYRRRSTVRTCRNVTEWPPSATVSTGRYGPPGGPGSIRLYGVMGDIGYLIGAIDAVEEQAQRRDGSDDAEGGYEKVLEERPLAIDDDLVA